MVINLDVPKDHETYLHRIGRAGRFGEFKIRFSTIMKFVIIKHTGHSVHCSFKCLCICLTHFKLLCVHVAFNACFVNTDHMKTKIGSFVDTKLHVKCKFLGRKFSSAVQPPILIQSG